MPEETNKKKKTILTIIGVLILYLISTGIAYAGFRYLGTSGTITPLTPEERKASGFKVDLSQPKTETCPLNGQKFTKDERRIWEGRRPLTVMIENHQEARPQSGLSKADVVYEAVAEGGITRFLAVFYCGASAEEVKLAPVRSARIYFINLAQEYGFNPIYVHIGGANNYGGGDTVKDARALEYLQSIGWRVRSGNDFDTTFDGSYPVFWRDPERLGHPVATEHTMVSNTERIWEEAHKRGFDAKDKAGIKWDEKFTTWKFKEDKKLEMRGSTTSIKFGFWEGYKDYSVEWQYNKDNNNYLRLDGGQPHKDLNNDQQLQAKVVIVEFAKERGPLDSNKHMLYGIIGEGKAMVFQDSEKIEATWKKTTADQRTKYFDSKGKEIELNRGPIWIEILPTNTKVSY